MQTLTDLMHAIDQLSPDDRQRLREYLDQRDHLQAGTLNFERLMHGVDRIREGLTPAEIQAMVDAMNEEYIEPMDEATWSD